MAASVTTVAAAAKTKRGCPIGHPHLFWGMHISARRAFLCGAYKMAESVLGKCHKIYPSVRVLLALVRVLCYNFLKGVVFVGHRRNLCLSHLIYGRMFMDEK